jgi:hypothetical protein
MRSALGHSQMKTGGPFLGGMMPGPPLVVHLYAAVMASWVS